MSSKKYLLILLLFLGSSFSFVQAQSASSYFTSDSALVRRFAETITDADLKRHLDIIASDSMEGRETGMPGQKKSAEYLVNYFKSYGLTGPVSNSTNPYLQPITLHKKSWKEVYLKINDEKINFLEDFYLYGDIEVSQEKSYQVILGGFGIEEGAYSDRAFLKQANMDVAGKAVILFSGEPKSKGISRVTGTKNGSAMGQDWRYKVDVLKKAGAALVFVVIGDKDADFYQRLSNIKEHLAAPNLTFTHKQKTSAVFIPHQLAAKLLGCSLEKLMEVKAAWAGDSLPDVKIQNKFLKKYSSSTCGLKVAVNNEKIQTENVLAFIEGTDKKEEVLVITAHYDHIGKEGNLIYNGADDDGSGTVALIELAQAFHEAIKQGYRPRRSILFMPVTAEEKGLMGSEFYSDFPVFPLSKTVANLNIDMIGRLDDTHLQNPDYIYIIGSDILSEDLHRINEVANKKSVNIALDYKYSALDDPNRFYFRSDHYNFAKHKIPVIFYFNGTHADYHKPTDTVEKINYPKMTKIVRLIFSTAWELVNRGERIRLK